MVSGGCGLTTTKSECNKTNGYYCSLSQSCIKQEQKCDGIVHCLHAEDENFDECKNIFIETATIQCFESNRTSKYAITIKATPCNEEKECKDKNDEDCEKNNLFICILLFSAFVVTAIICYSLHFSTTRQHQVVIACCIHTTIAHKTESNISDEAIRIRLNLKGNQLAELKVSTIHYNS